MKNKIRVHRAMNDLTQAKLAERVQVSRQTINAIELGKYNPSVKLALKMAAVMSTTVDELFQLEDADWKDDD